MPQAMLDGPGSGTSTTLAEAYDRILYPPSVFDQTHPERLATIAHLHGLAYPPVETARVLELGGGDGLNLLAMAATLPRASFLSIDIAQGPVRSGAALARAAGLANVRVEAADVLEFADSCTERFDYIIAHGVYAWVPDPVRTAIMQTMGALLSPEGVAFVSYDTEPGGRIRGIFRDMALAELPENATGEMRAKAGRAVIAGFAQPRSDDSVLMRGLRHQARLLVERPLEELAHDELGLFYAPQGFASVANAARKHGLAYLNDAERQQQEDGFPDPLPDSDAALIRAIQARDFQDLRFFRHSLFVRSGRNIQRRLDLGRLSALWLSFSGRRTGRHTFNHDAAELELADDRTCDVLEQAAAIFPHRLRIGPLDLGPERLDVLMRLYDNRACRLHSRQVAGVLDSHRPRASPLALAQLARGDERVARLDQAVTKLDGDVRSLLSLLDGSRDLTQLAELWAKLPASREVALRDAIGMLGRQALLLA